MDRQGCRLRIWPHRHLNQQRGRRGLQEPGEYGTEEYDELDMDARSTYTRHTVPVMLQQKSGTILMISSMAGISGFADEAVHCMTRFAQVGITQALDRDLRESGIKVILKMWSVSCFWPIRNRPSRALSKCGCARCELA